LSDAWAFFVVYLEKKGVRNMPKRLINEIRLSTLGIYQLWEEVDHVADFRDIVPDTEPYFQWLAGLPSFRFVGKEGHFTARQERRVRGETYWYAYRRQGKAFSQYLGRTSMLTITHLEEAAKQLAVLCSSQPKKKATRKKPVPRAVLMARIAEKDKIIAELQTRVLELEQELTTTNAKLTVQLRERRY
jgi:hypothetical protein